MTKRPLVFGEVLYDCFPENKKVLGGAPFNVAWHLQGFGCDPLFVSAVGNDALGQTVLDTASQWFSSAQAIEVNQDYPTGVVAIEFEDGTHSFEIRSNQAYDHITAEPLAEALAETTPPFLYHGTLALRSATSRKTLASIRKSVDAPVFVDLNLRTPWWDEARIRDAVANSHWLKLNEEELCIVTGKQLKSLELLTAEAHELAERESIAVVIVTLGANGAFAAVRGGKTVHAEPVPAANLVDTVGAGDSFSSVWLLGQLKGWSVEDSLNRASSFASVVCGIAGATSADRSLYADHLAAWRCADA